MLKEFGQVCCFFLVFLGILEVFWSKSMKSNQKVEGYPTEGVRKPLKACLVGFLRMCSVNWKVFLPSTGIEVAKKMKAATSFRWPLYLRPSTNQQLVMISHVSFYYFCS